MLIAALAGCPKSEAPRPDAAAPEAAPTAEASGVAPVYPSTVTTVPPAVGALCAALHQLPAERKAACCESRPGVMTTDECVRNLAGAVTQGGVILDLDVVRTCTTALDRQLQGCSWVGPHLPPLPAACSGALRGQRGADAVCRSNLECQGGLRCVGGGPTDPGRCRPAPGAGALCNTGVDPLATYLRLDVDQLRPPCADGFCDKNRCVAHVPAGGACRASVQCGPEQRCAKGACVAGAAGLVGEACTGADCAEGLRCVEGLCAAPRPEGAPCTRQGECAGGCVEGRCQKVCSAAVLLRALPKAGPKPPPAPPAAPGRP